ncbi:MAG: anti-phage defense ZorAB system ZorA [Proteobacteria bacterium]|nr:anti-phage defense ZorAB system ZorA [Pseudomonadota bacterium]
MDSAPLIISSTLALLSKLNLYILVPLCASVLGFFASYLRNYQWPAQQLKENLSQIIGQIKAVRSEQELSVRALEDKIDCIFEHSSFNYLWADYRQSLHTIYLQDSDVDIKAVLATVPAETFFSKESIIDLQINADFYRHLPGILTGIGIIGTFSGLVWGLHEFRPDPGQALESLPLLLQEVTSAFIGSGFAILAAIFITYKEKSILNQCYRLVEDLNKEIDSMHAMGTGEEYLSRLVKASESTPADMRELKASLMEDMTRLMHGVVERQTLAQQQQNQLLSSHISEAIKTALAEPMAQLSGVVQNVTSGQNEAVGGLLENLLQGFMSRLGDTLGEQIQGINSSIQSSSHVMGKVQDAMTRSIGEISTAGMSAADRMSDKLEDSLAKAVLAQQHINAQMLQQQQQSSEIMDTTIDRLSGKLEDSLSRVVAVQEKMNMQMLQQQQQSSEIMDAAIGRVSGKLEESLSRVVAIQEQMSVQTLRQQQQSSEMIDATIDRLSGKLEDSLSKVVMTQEQINLQTMQQQRQSSEMMDTTIERISGKLEDSLSKVSATQEQINLQILQQQQQSLAMMDTTIERISGKLEDSLSKVVAAQEQMNLQTLQQQKHSSEVIEVAMRAVLAKLQVALGGIAQDRSQQIEQDQLRHETLLASAQSLYAGFSDKVGGFIEDIKTATFKTEENLVSIQDTALRSISGMTESADVMRLAAERFTTAGNSMSDLTDTMTQTVNTMQQTADSVHQAFVAYDKSRDAVQEYVAQLQSNLDLVRRENGVSQNLVEDMERIVSSLASVERQSKEYLDRVNEVLKRSFQDFGIEMIGQVRNVSAESNRQLGSSLHALSSTVDSMIASVTKLRRAG